MHTGTSNHFPTRPRLLDPDDARGIALALLSAVGLGLAVAMARYAYEGGTNGLTVASIRSFVLAAVLFVYCRATGRSLGLGRADRRSCAWLGLLMSMGFYGNVGAVEYISIGLTALLFFTFPPLIGLIQAVLDRTWPALAKVAALATAFAGLATMLGASLGASDPRGVALVLAAAIAVALNSVGIVRLVGHIHPLVGMFHMAIASAVALPALTLATGSVQLPVSGMTALLFFTFPPLIGLIQAVLDRTWPALAKVAALATAFAGLATMLGASLGASDPRGVALVLAAAIAVALNSVGIVRLVGHIHPLVGMFHMAVTSAVALPALTLATGSVQLPVSGIGWAGTFGVIVFQCASLPLYFVAVTRIGALKTAMLSNLQPLTSIVAARVLFGELLGAVQLAGGAMVLAGVMLMQWHDARSRRTP